MDTESESVVTEVELSGHKDGRDEGEGNGDKVDTMEEIGNG